MPEINSVEYLKRVYKCVSGQQNQGVFILRFFAAAGCERYKAPQSGSIPTTELEGPRHWIKDRPLNDDIKGTFPDPILKESLHDFLKSHLSSEKVQNTMNEFGFPLATEVNEDAFVWALVEQFDAFVHSDEEDIDILYAEYQKYCQLSDDEIAELNAPVETRYAHDSFFIKATSSAKRHEVICHEKFSHSWEIRNYGRVLWHGRKLMLQNQYKKGPRAEVTEIEIPDTEPNQEAKIAANYDARGFEGDYMSEWIMCDTDGEDCFPNNTDFNFEISVHYHPNRTEEIK